MDPEGYAARLDATRDKHPLVISWLLRGEANRRAAAELYFDTWLLPALEEVVTEVQRAVEMSSSRPLLLGVGPLLERARLDLLTTIEAGFSGYAGVAVDSMRDLIEIEHLLVDFSLDLAGVEAWRQANRKQLRREYSTTAVRRRIKHVQGYENVEDSPDYRAHSQALHVEPRPLPAGERGIVPSDESGAVSFSEFFLHARRFLRAVDRLFSAGGASARDSWAELRNAQFAWERSQALLAAFVESELSRKVTRAQ